MNWYDYPALAFWGGLSGLVIAGVVLLIYEIITETGLEEWLTILGCIWVMYSVAWALHKFNLLENV